MCRHMLAVVLLLNSHWVFADTDVQTLAEESRDIIQTFSEYLQTELQAAMQDGGPVNAIGVCKTRAPAIAAELSANGWSVKRTSLKPRNPLNSPDAFEKETLNDFESKKQQGWSIDKLQYYKLNEVGLQAEFRYMQAIETRPLCLTCHGEKISSDILARLDASYPDDKARGYQAGDIRGAFSLRKRYRTEPVEDHDPQAAVSSLTAH